VILADTSVWVEAQRRPDGATAETLRALIDSDDLLLALPVRLELLAGLPRAHRGAFMRALTALPIVIPTEDTWRVVEGWIAPAADRGHRFAVTDLLVAALAHEVDALVWSLDSDFEQMEELGLAKRYA
jgi:predicted nucleic acid-binding protein